MLYNLYAFVGIYVITITMQGTNIIKLMKGSFFRTVCLYVSVQKHTNARYLAYPTCVKVRLCAT